MLGITAVGFGQSKVPADVAVVEAIPSEAVQFSDAPPAGSSLGGGFDHSAIRTALSKLGIRESAVSFGVQSQEFSSDAPAVRVEVPVAKLPRIARDVAAQIRRFGDKDATIGLRFGVSNCATALSTARSLALTNAHERALVLATAAGIHLGSVRTVSETPTSATAILGALGAPAAVGQVCPSDASQISVFGSLTSKPMPFDAKPEVQVSDTVSVSYALPANADRTISATGNSTTTGAADHADVIVIPSSEFSFAPDPSALPDLPGVSLPAIPAAASRTKQEAQITTSLISLGLARSDIEVELSDSDTSPFSSYVRVALSSEQLPKLGHKIVDAIERTVGSDATSGVLFTSTDCKDITARTEEAALKDAQQRINALAAVENQRIGAVIGVNDDRSLSAARTIDPCVATSDDELENAEGLIAGALYGGATLVPLDALPQIKIQAAVTVTRAIR